MAAPDYTREELIALCERAPAQMSDWYNRDSASAHLQLGQAWALLRAGCPFQVITVGHMATTDTTIWVHIEWKGFQAFELGLEDGGMDDDEFYIPTAKRLDDVGGRDWY